MAHCTLHNNPLKYSLALTAILDSRRAKQESCAKEGPDTCSGLITVSGPYG